MTVLDAVKLAHDALKKAVPWKRRKAAFEDGALAQTYIEAMRIWDQEKADGVPLAMRQQQLERTLRLAWPQTRVWKYVCERCGDTGWENRVCTRETHCGRRRCEPGHDYVVPCVCPKGEARNRQLHPKATPEDFQQAGKRKGFTKVGR